LKDGVCAGEMSMIAGATAAEYQRHSSKTLQRFGVWGEPEAVSKKTLRMLQKHES
jgi:hypothetical protein